jgi:hypothetical protein
MAKGLAVGFGHVDHDRQIPIKESPNEPWSGTLQLLESFFWGNIFPLSSIPYRTINRYTNRSLQKGRIKRDGSPGKAEMLHAVLKVTNRM